MPRFLVREGFEELEFAIYFPMEFSFPVGAGGKQAEFLYLQKTGRKILELWRDESLLSCGEIDGDRLYDLLKWWLTGEESIFIFFSNTDLKGENFSFSLRRLDSLDLRLLFIIGKLTSRGILEDYSLELDLRGGGLKKAKNLSSGPSKKVKWKEK